MVGSGSPTSRSKTKKQRPLVIDINGQSYSESACPSIGEEQRDRMDTNRKRFRIFFFMDFLNF